MANQPTTAERRRQQTDERRKKTAALVATDAPATGTQLSFAAQTLTRAFPQDLIREGAIRFDPQGQPRVGTYAPALLAPNPQRGRVADRDLDVLAASLNADGQQEPIVARLITDTDRKRWPDAFSDRQLLVILKGHRIFFAQPKTKLAFLKVELLLPQDGEDDLAYSRRALRRAAIKLMHSQGYDIFDKVNQYEIWRTEFALPKPKDQDVAAYFDISRTEAQRIKTVAKLDDDVARDIVNAERRPADEVIFLIANRPPEEHRDAFERFGELTVTAARKLAGLEQPGKPEHKLTGPGRPRNYVLAVKDEDIPIAYISTDLTTQEWQRRGGARAFWDSIRELVNRRDLQDRLTDDLG
jgi:hypothetical protein